MELVIFFYIKVQYPLLNAQTCIYFPLVTKIKVAYMFPAKLN